MKIFFFDQLINRLFLVFILILSVDGLANPHRINLNHLDTLSISGIDNKLTGLTGQQIANELTLLYQRQNNNVSVVAKPSPKALIKAQQENLLRLRRVNQSINRVDTRFNRKNGTPSYIKGILSDVTGTIVRGKNGRPSQKIADDFFMKNRELLKLNDPNNELRLKKTQVDHLGQKHYRYERLHHGIPFFNSEMVVHVDENDQVFLFQGRYEPSIDGLEVIPKISQLEAENIAKSILNTIDVWRIRTELTIFETFAGENLLAYSVDIMPDMSERWILLIDAMRGEMIHRIHNIHHVGEVINAAGQDLLGDIRSFTAWRELAANASLNQYYMLDPSTPFADPSYDPINNGPNVFGDIFIYDARNTRGSKLDFSTSNNATQGWDPAAVSAMANTRQVYQYYLNTFGRKSLDNNNQNLLVMIHFDNQYNNAFWNGSFMVYGDGDNVVFDSLAQCLDIAAHEMTHGVIENTANLLYENQSGALSESFADIFATMVDRQDWTLGEDCTLAQPGFLRHVAQPQLGLSPQPTKMSEYRNLPNTPNGNNGGVHINSGIPNRAAYLMAQGLTEEGLGRSIGRDKTEQIFYRALDNYLFRSAQFIDARRATVQAAEDLYGVSSDEVKAVNRAWDVVEVLADAATEPGLVDPPQVKIDVIEGDDVMVYLSPADGSHDAKDEVFDVYMQKISNVNAGYDPQQDFGPLNPVDSEGNRLMSAAYTRPAVFTRNNNTYILYVGIDYNLYLIDPTAGSHFPLTSSADVRSIAASPSGKHLAFTSTDPSDNAIHLLDISNMPPKETLFPIVSVNYQQDKSEGANTIQYPKAMAFDYTSRLIVFDALNCIATPDSQCDAGEGYFFWSIGLLDITDGSLFYPFPNQNSSIDLGFPTFATNNNYLIALDKQESIDSGAQIDSSVVVINLETQALVESIRLGQQENPVSGVPSFWGNDQYLTVQYMDERNLSGRNNVMSAFRVPIDETGAGNVAQGLYLSHYAVAMPIMHRVGERVVSGVLDVSQMLLDFGEVEAGNATQQSVVVSNVGNREVSIDQIDLTGDSGFSHTATNTRLQPGRTLSFSVKYAPSDGIGTQIGFLEISSDGEPKLIRIALTGVAMAKSAASAASTQVLGLSQEADETSSVAAPRQSMIRGGGCTVGSLSGFDPVLLLLGIIAWAGLLRKKLN